MDILIMTGARPNFMKVAPLVEAIHHARQAGRDVAYRLVYVGRENDPTLEGSLFEDLQMPRPDIFLGVDSCDPIEITSLVMARMESLLREQRADVVLVVDDLASTMATAIVAKRQGLKLAHLAAGTRSFDINMPKEINRLVIDGLSDYLFTAGQTLGTTADTSKIYNVGNILMDTLRRNLPRFRSPDCLNALRSRDGGSDGDDDGPAGSTPRQHTPKLSDYIVLTINRKALLASARLGQLLRTMSENAGGLPIFAPLREEAREKMEGLALPNLVAVGPLPYLEFGYITSRARMVITDSGNVADEATFNGVPCITLNNYTEHAETVKQGTNILVNEDAELLAATMRGILSGDVKQATIPERWDGRTAERILQTLLAQG